MNLAEARDFLRENVGKESERYYGIKDVRWLDQVTANWFDDKNNYDGRWEVIVGRIPVVGRVLDIAAGCGTFVLYGLQKGYDVWGIEPEKWKQEYFRRKVEASGYPAEYLKHVVGGVGEELPFEDESFDLVTTYQTLEHVRDVNRCIGEMLRVLKPQGILYIRAPDYNCFFEPHYRVPFFPKMNKKLAAAYLRAIGRPTLGLDGLKWVTERDVIALLRRCEGEVRIEKGSRYYSERRRRKMRDLLPSGLRKDSIVRLLDIGYVLTSKLASLTKVGRQERNINLWVTKKG